jgi:hypothetical protein
MACVDVKSRPTAHDVTQSAALAPFTVRSSTQLRRELNDERVKNEALSRQLEDTRCALHDLQDNGGNHGNSSSMAAIATGNNRQQRIVGRACGRSRSLVTF